MDGKQLTTYPEGWEYAKSLLEDVPEDKRDAYLTGYMMFMLA